MNEIRVMFNSQFDLMKAELKASLNRIDKFTKSVTQMKDDMKQRDEALKRVPANTNQILKDLSQKMDKTMSHVDTVDAKFS